MRPGLLVALVIVRTFGEFGTSAMLPLVVIWAHRTGRLADAAACTFVHRPSGLVSSAPAPAISLSLLD